MSEVTEQPKDKDYYASEGADTWIDLLRNTTVMEATGKTPKRPSSPNFRQAPDEEDQPDFFKTPLLDIAHKDDFNLMDFNPFGLGKKPRFDTIEYKLKNAVAKVYGSTEHGLATVYDYDVVIFMISHLAKQMNDVKRSIEEGKENPQLPSRRMQVYATEMLEGLSRKRGGQQQAELVEKLQRLKGTVIEIEGEKGTKRRIGTFSLIGDFQVVKNTKTGAISEFFIDIPQWIYDGVVRVSDPTIVSLSNDYMLLKSGYHKFLSRMAKKSAGSNSWEWTIEGLYERSGSNQPMAQFKRDIKKAIDKLADDPLDDYRVFYIEGEGRGKKKSLKVHFEHR